MRRLFGAQTVRFEGRTMAMVVASAERKWGGLISQRMILELEKRIRQVGHVKRTQCQCSFLAGILVEG